MDRRRANYALIEFSEHLGARADSLDVPWAEFVGDRTTAYEFTVPASPTDGYLTIQALDVGSFDHEVLINGEALTGFDLPPADGWQCWMDVITGTDLVEGRNTVAVRRDPDSDDAFVIGTVRVGWREPAGASATDDADI